MKCIPQAEPLSAIRAANGPWYQRVSKVGIPRAQASWRPVPQWAATNAAATRANTSCGKETAGAGGEGDAGGAEFPVRGVLSVLGTERPSGTPNQTPSPTAIAAVIRTAGTRIPNA